MIAVDTNLLVYAHRRDSQWHEPAQSVMSAVAEGTAPWAIPWPCVHEFLAVVTRPRIYSPPSSLSEARDQVAAWLESPTLVLLSEGDGYWDTLSAVLQKSRADGARVHDARIAALCIHHRVRELWTADRDFSRFGALATRNPLVKPAR
ncbi:MAG: toxin PIN [Acidobacteria bacterium RIFCSPLOWO2_12_FULL_67_14b]|nr:MAG: toxin PIN [Acidobacteria bacterium RIFCSPLOWO2_12_FULL_67_14b]